MASSFSSNRRGERSATFWSLALTLGLLSHCNKQEPSPSAEATPPSTAAQAQVAAPPNPSPTPASEPSPPASASAEATAPGPCGEEGQPDCPLQGFMKREVKAPLKAGEFEKAAAALEKVSTVAPKGYDEWSSFAKSAAKAVNTKDAGAIKKACKTCHDKYEDKFKEEHRTDKLL